MTHSPQENRQGQGSVALRSRQITCCFLRCYLTMQLIRKAFKSLHYPVDIIAQCVRWYLAYSLSLRNLEEMMAERGIVVDHSTLHRWVIRLVPLLNKAFRRHKRAVGYRWRMDETYIKIKGQWKYLARSIVNATIFDRFSPFLMSAIHQPG